jgi:hypothetical protein
MILDVPSPYEVARQIYFRGPKLFGFWNGIQSQDACSELTKVPSSVWVAQTQACSDLLDREFVAYGIGFALAAGLFFTYKLTNFCIWSSYLRQIKSIVPCQCSTAFVQDAKKK